MIFGFKSETDLPFPEENYESHEHIENSGPFTISFAADQSPIKSLQMQSGRPGNHKQRYFGGSKGSHNRKQVLSIDIASIHTLVREHDSRLLGVIFKGDLAQEIFKIGCDVV